MKKTFNINIAGFPFTIDDDAYSLLNDYLDAIEHAFKNVEDSQELVNDIECRIAELLLEYTSSSSPIVTVTQVEDVIKRIGKPEEMIAEDETISISGNGEKTRTDSFFEEVTPPPFTQKNPYQKKKLFRDPQNAMLGGVCSGLGWYLNCDPTWIRLATVLLTFASISTCGIVYLVLWLVLPEAKTPLERMQMMGESPTIENIGKTVTDSFKEDNGQKPFPQQPTDSSTFAQVLSSVFGILAKVLIIIGLIIGLPILIGLAIALIGCVFSLILFGTSTLSGFLPFGADTESESITILYGIIAGIGFIIFLGIPLFMLIRKGISPKAKPLSKTTSWILSILCVLGFFTAAFAIGKIINEDEKNDRISRYGIVTINQNRPLSPEVEAERACLKAEQERQRAEKAQLRVEKARLKAEKAKERAAINAEKKALIAEKKAVEELEKAERKAQKAKEKAERAKVKAEKARLKADSVSNIQAITLRDV